MITPAEVRQGVDGVIARGYARKSLAPIQMVPGGMGQFVAPLLLDRSPYDPDVDQINSQLGTNLSLSDNYPVVVYGLQDRYRDTGVSERYDSHGVRLPVSIGSQRRGVIIGTGVGGILTGRVISDLGIKNLEYLSSADNPLGLWGGLWGEDKEIGYNNPGEIFFQNAHLPITRFRWTHTMQQFLNEAASADMQSLTINGTVTGRDFVPGTGKQIIRYTDRDGEKKRLMPVDFVVVATGQEPLPLDDGYIDFSIPKELPVKRWPALFTSDEITALNQNNQRVLLVGWGNSTMAKLREIDMINRTPGINIQAVVLSHLSDYALDHPSESTLQPDGNFRRLARNVAQQEYTRLEMDLFDSEQRYWKHRNTRFDTTREVVAGTIADVVACDIQADPRGFYNAHITTRNARGDEIVQIVPNIGELDAFIGFGNNITFMDNLGLVVTDQKRGTVARRTYDGKCETVDGGDVYIAGAAAATREDPSARVVPGAIRMAKQIGLTEVFEAAAQMVPVQ